MNDGVELILKRMDSHPEEFTTKDFSGHNRWSRLIDYYEKVLTDEELATLKAKQTEILRDEFTASVMEEILREPKKETLTFNTSNRSIWESQKAHTDSHEIYKQQLQAQIDHYKQNLK